jgi:hypothetical protein
MIKSDGIKKMRINELMQTFPKGLVLLSQWLVSQGYSFELQQRYRKSGWLKSIGRGAMLKSGDAPVLSGALAALQEQAGLNIHIGGRSALGLLGLSHYLQLNAKETTLFAETKILLPAWFAENQWDTGVKIYYASLFENLQAGLTDYHDGDLTVKISSSARALMECLSLCPTQFPLTEAYELMEGLATLRPANVQLLLESCKSVKVKRLFLFFAEKIGQSWFKHIDINKIDLGKGDRSLATNGAYIAKYKLVLPKELIQ